MLSKLLLKHKEVLLKAALLAITESWSRRTREGWKWKSCIATTTVTPPFQCCTLLPALLLVSSGQLGKPWLLIGWEGNGGSWRTLPELLQCWGRWWNLALIVHNNALDCSAMQCKVGLHVYIDLRSLLLTLHLPPLLQVLLRTYITERPPNKGLSLTSVYCTVGSSCSVFI